MAKQNSTDELMINDLARSGLTKADAKKMGLVVCDEDRASVVLNSDFCTYGYLLPYFDISGKQTETLRFRFLNDLLNGKGKIVKYSQPKGTSPHLYFPPCIKWPAILKDVSTVITFTEGEKKAYKACKEGIPTIGLSGVWAFKSKRLNKKLIDDFKSIDLKDREVHLCFDSDYQSNEEVLKALRMLAKEINRCGASVFNKALPFNPYQKTGLDDYLLNHTVKQYHNLPLKEFEDISAVNELNSEVAYIKEVGKFYILKHGLFVGGTALKNDVYTNRTIVDGDKMINVAGQWLCSPGRREHIRLTYKPGQPRITDLNEYNLWEGWACEPQKGSVRPFMFAVSKMFGGDKELIKWFLDWAAYPIQYPGTKMLTAVLIQSIGQGTGKSSLGMCLGAMYGRNYKLIDDEQLSMSYNEWAVNKQFVVGDEISGKDKKSEADKIKNLITRPTVTINKKWAPTYEIPDCISYYFTSNHVDALNLEPDDRRVFVYMLALDNYLTHAQGKALERYHKQKTHTKYLLHYFAFEHKISKDFDYTARPPMTQAKADLIDHSLTDIERFLTHVKENAQFALAIDGVPIDRDLFTTAQIVSLYKRVSNKREVSLTAMGKALNKIFFEGETYVVRTLTGTKRLHALRNVEKWNKSNGIERRDHYDKSKIALFEARQAKMRRSE
ncbi:MAG TPA: DUF3854 domain-containing protein [Spirochaetes bacterium]|nr:DUF3854 domain-containing protein [Spirochaetota bacterium]